MPTNASPRNVLVIRFSALGDVAITIPVLYSVCHAHPDTRFVMVTRQWSANLFIDRPANLVVRGVDVTNDYSGPWGMMRLAHQLRKQYQIDAVADLHSVLRSWIMGAVLRLRGVKIARIDKGHSEKRQLTKGKIRRQLTPTIDRYADVFNRLGWHATRHLRDSTMPRPLCCPPRARANAGWPSLRSRNIAARSTRWHRWSGSSPGCSSATR